MKIRPQVMAAIIGVIAIVLCVFWKVPSVAEYAIGAGITALLTLGTKLIEDKD